MSSSQNDRGCIPAFPMIRVRHIITVLLLLILSLKQFNLAAQAAIDLSVIQGEKGYRISDVAVHANDSKIPILNLLRDPGYSFIIDTEGGQYKSKSSDRYNWYRFVLKNNSDKLVSFKVINGNNQINEMELFKLKGDSAISLGKAGRIYPFYQRPYPFLHFTFPVQLAPNEEATFIYYADCRGISYRVMLFLFNDSAFKKGEQRIYSTYGFFAGILLLASLFNLFLFLMTKERIHFAYSLYSLSVIFSVCSLQSLDFQFLYPNFPVYTRTAIATYTSISCMILLWVMQLFLKQTAANSKFYRLVNIVKLVWAFIPVLAFYVINFTTSLPWVKTYLTIYPVMLGSTFLLALVCCIEKLMQGYKLALFYLVAISFVIMSGTLMALGIFERRYYLSLPPTLYDLSIIVEALIICFGILFRYIIIRKERDKLERALRQQQLESSKKLIFTQEQERRRIAEDLHDELGGSLATLKLRVQRSSLPQNQMTELLEMLDKASADTRNISHNLMPPEFEKTNFEILLRGYYNRLSTQTQARFHFHCSGYRQAFTKDTELIIYRILMELTSNIIKHAKATEATIQLIYFKDHIEIMVEDNGKGMLNPGHDGIGMKNIQSRVNYLGGTMKTDSGTGGTTVMINIPYKTASYE